MKKSFFPIGIDSFEKLRTENCYYIDKTDFIEELLQDKFEVTLITRPRRFGKTLNVSMLASFFDIRKDSGNIFEGLAVSRNKALCNRWMNQWPVLFLTLKNVEGLTFDSAYGSLKSALADLCIEHSYLMDSDSADDGDKQVFRHLKARQGNDAETKDALYMLMRMMKMHYDRPVILLIDEYDVPLAKASEGGYYLPMLDVLRSLLGKVFKTNPFLKFAVTTGCLRIAKESIFTGTNNFVSYGISSRHFQKYFGFTEEEVQKLLADIGLSDHIGEIKSWYDGYLFGKNEIYCPWDVLNHVNRLQYNPHTKPANYWRNTSHNSIIRSFIDRTDLAVNDKFEILLSGECIWESVSEDLTYDVLYSSEANLWSILYLTGYLTRASVDQSEAEYPSEGKKAALKIPNEEIKTIFADTIATWFTDIIKNSDRQSLFDAFWSGNEKQATELVTDLLFDTISYYDYKEDYYHAFLAGIFTGAGYAVESNREYGLGRPDIVIRDRKNRRVIIIEVKHSKTESRMQEDAQAAVNQIDMRAYVRQFLKGYQSVYCYGASFFEKECLIISCIL